ncbi:MAG: MoxR family ATPase [Clostridiales Family XIII bacterium]|jgi:MoxR-like ATPase|nr:MoxR family ATPase [Clostridiales Family XIII bacterium]
MVTERTDKGMTAGNAAGGFQGSSDYVASEELMSAVNIAIALEKPLLIKGEPGTGKTMLARAISDALGKELIIWNIKSTTKAKDGLYLYDTVQRLYDSQFGEGDVSDIGAYIRYGKLGEAFRSDAQAVLLIDEIDKADLEFPNDLLWELDQMEFYIPETKETVAAKKRPIVIITSNAEKELPDAFLRRCIFHYIEFPTQEKMEEIVRVHYPDIEAHLLAQAMEEFYRIRSVRDLQKKPGTSELLDWLRALMLSGISPERLSAELGLPHLGVLLKKDRDIDTVRGGGSFDGRSRGFY